MVRNLYQPTTILGLEPVSIIHYTRPGSSIKQPTQNYLATQRHVNWPVIYPKSSCKIIDSILVALPQNHRRIFVATLIQIIPPNSVHAQKGQKNCSSIIFSTFPMNPVVLKRTGSFTSFWHKDKANQKWFC